jgi:putative methionine-R-sulfoxide reductase with GAF domain
VAMERIIAAGSVVTNHFLKTVLGVYEETFKDEMKANKTILATCYAVNPKVQKMRWVGLYFKSRSKWYKQERHNIKQPIDKYMDEKSD